MEPYYVPVTVPDGGNMMISKDDKSLSPQSNRKGEHLHRTQQEYYQFIGTADLISGQVAWY